MWFFHLAVLFRFYYLLFVVHHVFLSEQIKMMMMMWFSCSQGWKWMVHNTLMSCCSNSTVAARHLSNCWRRLLSFARALNCCDTRLQTSHQMWPPNRPDLSSVDYRLLRVVQECVCQKEQGMSNIVDELWLLTEWYFIKRMTYYISQGRAEAPIRIGG